MAAWNWSSGRAAAQITAAMCWRSPTTPTSKLRATSDEYFEALEAARQKFPELILLAGLEWNVPPWQGREHATVLAPAGPGERQCCATFRCSSTIGSAGRAIPTGRWSRLRWLGSQAMEEDDLPVVFYNHPSRSGAEPAPSWQWSWAVVRGELRRGRDSKAAPATRIRSPIGKYQETLPTIDRWDPAAAHVGDAWDQLLGRGTAVWGALATSDFHQRRSAAGPTTSGRASFRKRGCMPRTHSPGGPGSAAGGQLLWRARPHCPAGPLTAWTDGLARPAIAGEAIYGLGRGASSTSRWNWKCRPWIGSGSPTAWMKSS